MIMKIEKGIKVWGDIDESAVDQMVMSAKDDKLYDCALMADHHLGYSVPIGGVVAYREHISPSATGYDIACGNKAVLIDTPAEEVKKNISTIMDDVYKNISFGVGRKNKEEVEHELFEDDPAWDLEHVGELKDMARSQLGTVGSGNHYVDIFEDEKGRTWIGCHFGSRGLGHKLATYYVKAGGGVDSMHAEPTLLSIGSTLGQEYIECMKLAGRYAYAGRDWVCNKVAKMIGGVIMDEVHNHHNFAWQETHGCNTVWVVRKGATPAFPGQRGFVGGSMGDISVILEGVDSPEANLALNSTVHGAGRVMSRTQASGKKRYKKGKLVKLTEGEVSNKMMRDWIDPMGVELRGGGTDESPHCYKRIVDVLKSHQNTIKILHTLTPLGVAMAGEDVYDPFKD